MTVLIFLISSHLTLITHVLWQNTESPLKGQLMVVNWHSSNKKYSNLQQASVLQTVSQCLISVSYLCSSVHLNYTCYLMREFSNYSRISSVLRPQVSGRNAPCSAPKMLLVGVDVDDVHCSQYATHTHPVWPDLTPHSCVHSFLPAIIILHELSCFHDHGKPQNNNNNNNWNNNCQFWLTLKSAVFFRQECAVLI